MIFTYDEQLWIEMVLAIVVFLEGKKEKREDQRFFRVGFPLFYFSILDLPVLVSWIGWFDFVLVLVWVT